MGMKFIKKIPTAEEIIAQIPLPKHIEEIKRSRIRSLRKYLPMKINEFLLIIVMFPDNRIRMRIYQQLAKFGEGARFLDFLVPRIYTNKPRTTVRGMKECTPPDPAKSRLCEGISAISGCNPGLSEFHRPQPMRGYTRKTTLSRIIRVLA
jgi:3-deoxy-7-phosphoheptulonate synthase